MSKDVIMSFSKEK